MALRKKLLAAGLGLGIVLAWIDVQPAVAAQRVVIVRPWYAHPWYGYTWRPGWRPYYVVPQPATGEVKINTHEKRDTVYVDGGYAGQTDKLKKFSLLAGNHLIEIRDVSGQVIFHQTISVILDRTTEIKLNG